MEEAAQKNNIRDGDNVLDITPNDDSISGVFDFITKPWNLYYSKYESDGYHTDMYGNEVRHRKGDWELDKNGNPFVRTLQEGEDSSNKQFLSITDTLSDEGSFINKYDFFDSDGIDKSLVGVAAKTVATIAPLFIPYVGSIYGYGLIAGNFSEALTNLGKTSIEYYDDDFKTNSTWNLFNSINATTKSLVTQKAISDKGSESMWNLEQLGALLGDIATQGIQQRIIAKGAGSIMKTLGYDATGMNIQNKLVSRYGDTYLKQYGKSLKKAIADGDVNEAFISSGAGRYFTQILKQRDLSNKVSRNASSLYMALTQTSGLIDDMKSYGFSPGYTAIGAIGAIIGFNKIMNSELGDVALKGLGYDELGKGVNDFFKKLAKAEAAKVSKDVTGKGVLAAIKKTSNGVADFLKNKINSSEI